MSAKVLIVDDEPAVLHMLRRMFQAKNYQVVEALAAEDAVGQFHKQAVDVVVTDLKMPGHDGLWLAETIQAKDPDMPILLLTAYADIGSAQQAISMGLYGYFTKPIDVHQILKGVENALEQRRLVLENRAYQADLEHRVELRTRDLERAYQELILTEKTAEVGRLAAGVVHEVLNPLSVVMGRLEMVLMDDALLETHRKSLQLARVQLNRAVKIMDNLRSFSKQRKPIREAIDINALLDHTLELVVHELRKTGVEVETAFDTLPFVWADEDQLLQVFLNLVKNAIEAMPSGGILTIRTTCSDWEGDEMVDVAVCDTGEGIAPENVDRIFDLFFTTKKNGTGLGLGICRGIVESHGGQLVVDSQPGQGATMRICLPVYKDQTTEAMA